jgi:NodT family efflux transporter outer membrane factor (OMF) lipoprotein
MIASFRTALSLRFCRCCIPLIGLVAGCTLVGPAYERPPVDAPVGWEQALEAGLNAQDALPIEWWRVFNDPALDELITRARQGNNNLQIAGLRVLESRAQLGIATGNLYPQVQVLEAGATYVSPSEADGPRSSFWQYGISASVAWELDFWGRFSRAIESADAAFLASVAAYDQANVLLIAGVVDAYTVIRTAEGQLRISRENVVLQERSYDIARVLFENGADSELDMQQANTLLLATRASIPTLEAAVIQASNALSTLLGLPPGRVRELIDAQTGIPAVPAEIAIGVPADMLRRRPDVREAEALALAQNALVGLAEADLYPSFSLIGSIGVSAGGPGDSDFGDLFDADAIEFAAGPSLVWPFLNYGRIRNNVRVQDARLQQALVNYRETVLQAAREAEDAVAGFIGSRAQADILADTVVSAKRSNELSTLRYREGFSDYQRVLDAQQALFAQQQRYVAAQGETVRNLIALYKALGGGWQTKGPAVMINDANLEMMRERTNWGDLLEPEASGTGEQDHQNDWD